MNDNFQAQTEYVDKIELNDIDLQRIEASTKYLKPLDSLIISTDDKHYHYYETIAKYYELVTENKKLSPCCQVKV